MTDETNPTAAEGEEPPFTPDQLEATPESPLVEIDVESTRVHVVEINVEPRDPENGGHAGDAADDLLWEPDMATEEE